MKTRLVQHIAILALIVLGVAAAGLADAVGSGSLPAASLLGALAH